MATVGAGLPSGGRRGAGAAALGRPMLAVVFGAVVTLAIAALFGRSGWSWVLGVPAGLVVGAAVRGAGVGWLGALGILAGDGLSHLFSWPRDEGGFWWLASACTAAVFLAAVIVGRRARQGSAIGSRDRRAPGRAGKLPGIAAGLAIVAGLGYTGYIGIRSYEFTEAAVTSADCRTPTDRYGWTYEPVNYDAAVDAEVRGPDPDRRRCTVPGAPAGDQVVSSDGVRLANWYIPAESDIGPTGPTLVVVHGWKSDKTGALDYVAPFHADFNLLLVDLRNHGQSAGDLTSMGLWEQRDVGAFLDWLVAAKHPAWIGAVGNSMGGATTLAVAAHDERIRALILDSMHADSVTSAENALENDFTIPGGPAAWALVTGISIRVGGDATSVDPIRNVGLLGDRPVLFVQGTADQVDPPLEAADRNLRAALAAGVPAEIAYCPAARHGRVQQTCPELWAGWTLAFLDRALDLADR